MIFGAIINAITGGLFSSITDISKAYFNKQISEAEANAKIQTAIQAANARIEEAQEQATTQIAESSQATIRASVILQRAVGFVVISQTLVLMIYQIGGLVWPLMIGVAFPEPAITIEWAYALVVTGIGGGWLLRK